MRRKDIRKWLKQYTEDCIYYSKHVKDDKFEAGKVSEVDVRKNLLNPINLLRYEEQESLNSNEFKYKLHFRLSSSKDLGIIVLINKKIKVITAYEIERKWQEKIMVIKWTGK